MIGPAIKQKDVLKLSPKETFAKYGPGIFDLDKKNCQIELTVESRSWLKKIGHDTFYDRSDGPAREFFDGDMHFYRNGKLHNLRGPALVQSRGSGNCWYVNGDYIEKEDFQDIKKIARLNAWELFTPVEIAQFKKQYADAKEIKKMAYRKR